MSFTGWFDRSGMVHVRQGEYSENGPLFTAEYYALDKDSPVGGILKVIHEITKKGFFDPNPNDDNSSDVHFSHDNMTGLYVLHRLANVDCNDLPTFKWNGRWWLHPRDIAFYNLMKENIWSKLFTIPFLLLLLGASLVSCSANRGRTSGKMLVWTRMMALSLHTSIFVTAASKMIWRLCEILLKRTYGNNPMIEVSSIYFKEENHPVNELMRELYGIK